MVLVASEALICAPFPFLYSEEMNGNALQYSGLENPMDRGAWRFIVYGFTKSRT